MLYPYMTACRLYSLHRVFLRFCLSEYGTYRTAHSCADISIGHEVAVGVALAAVVDAALGALALQHTALAALGADAAGILHETLGAPALGEAAAGKELAELEMCIRDRRPTGSTCPSRWGRRRR